MSLLKDITVCAFDIETSGANPLSSQICEIAAVKWNHGKIVDKYSTLINPGHKMSDFIISIHGITNEMVLNAPKIEQKIFEFENFIKDSYCVAHHAPFDMGFIAIEFEKRNIKMPINPVFCSSLISRKAFPESVNHKLQTLVNFFNLQKNTAHRALDDAESCLSVFLKCIEKFGEEKEVEDLLKYQGRRLLWNNFLIKDIQQSSKWMALVEGILNQKDVRICVLNHQKLKTEIIKPEGLVRNPDGDFIFAYSYEEKRSKRYYLNKISESEIA